MIALARLLGPAAYGQLVYVQTWYMALLPLAIFGLASVIVREAGRSQLAATDFLNHTVAFRTASAAVATMACWVLALLYINEKALSLLFVVFGAALFFRAIASWSTHAFIGFEQSQYVLRQNVVFRTGEAALGITLLYVCPDSLLIAVLHALCWFLESLSSLFIVRKRLFSVMPSWKLKELRLLFISGFPLMISALLSTWLVQGPLILARPFFPHEDHVIGQLGIAFQVLLLAQVVPWSIGAASVPLISREADASGENDSRLLSLGIQWGILTSVGLGMVGHSVIPQILPLFLGDRYSLAGNLTAQIIWCLTPITIAVAASNSLVARGEFYLLPRAAAVGAGILLLSHNAMINEYETSGVIVSAALGVITWALALSTILLRVFRISAWHTFIVPILLSAMSLIPYFSLRNFHWFPALVAGAGCISLSIAWIEASRRRRQ